jgi:Tc5 transposase DNA-binding domain
LTEVDEELLASWILLWADCGLPKTKSQILTVAGEIASLDADANKHFKNDTPSSFWFANFLKRHPEVRQRIL